MGRKHVLVMRTIRNMMRPLFILLSVILTMQFCHPSESKQTTSIETNMQKALQPNETFFIANNYGKQQDAHPKVLFLFFHDRGSHYASMKPLMNRCKFNLYFLNIYFSIFVIFSEKKLAIINIFTHNSA